MYFYKTYNLTICSDIELPQLLPTKKHDSDIIIKCDTLPEYIYSDIKSHPGPSGKGKNFYWINTPGGYIAIMDSNQIFIDIKPNADISLLRSYILGYALSCSFLYRNIPAIHSSSIERTGKSIILMGGSGSGKSTLTARFLNHGYRLVSDDVVMVEAFADHVTAYSAFPQRKLCRDAAVNFNHNLNELTYIDEQKDKFAISCPEDFCEAPTTVQAIVFIQPTTDATCKIEELLGPLKLQTFLDNLFLHPMFKRFNMPPEHFINCVKIINLLPLYILYRPINSGDTTKIQMKLIEGIIR